MDKISRSLRSRNMSRIKATNTKPEVVFRKALYKLGFRYRIHLPIKGKPDITFPSKKIAIFINGCFWHGHINCIDGHIPKSNRSYWEKKITMNKRRDRLVKMALRKSGWKIVTIWECQISRSLNRQVVIVKKLIAGN
ncbi:DNA mismatch endonuclease Vsr [Patescibacteria group bacterium]|nr:DNA mismatch endonuclease Vsr [Patescibacteria group bacterium]